MHVPVQSGPRIPPGGLGIVLQPHGQHIALRLQQPGRIQPETAVAIGPVTDLLSVEIDPGIAHGSVEKNIGPFPGGKIRHVETNPVPTGPDDGQSPGTSGFKRRNGLAVLLDGHELRVVADVERPVNRPVVRNRHALPGRIVEIRTNGLRMIFAGKSPALFQFEFRPGGECGKSGQ